MKKRNIILIPFAILIAAVFGGVVWYYFSYSVVGNSGKNENTKDDEQKEQIVTGVISNIDNIAKIVSVKNDDDKEILFVFNTESKLLGKDEKEIGLDYLKKGFTLFGIGSKTNGNSIDVFEARILREPNIIVYSPKSGEGVLSPITLRGMARVFENSLNYELTDENGRVIAKNFVIALSLEDGQYGAFELKINYSEPEGENGILEVFNYSAKGGTKENVVVIPMIFRK